MRTAALRRCRLRQASVGDFAAGLFLDGFGKLDEPLGGVGPAIEQHVFDQREQIGGNLFIDRPTARR